MKYNVVVIDDEKPALDVMCDYVSKTPSLNLIGYFQDPTWAVEFINANQVDILFTDIQMPNLTGIQLLNALANVPAVIFTTAYSEYAADSYDVDAVDYLLKPILYHRFLKSITKADSILSKSNNELPPIKQSLEYTFLKVEQHWEKVLFNDVTYIQSYGDYIKVNLLNGASKLSLMTMNQAIDKFKAHDFVRIHRSYIVNVLHVEVIEKDHLYISGKDISIGKQYRAEIMAKISSKNLL